MKQDADLVILLGSNSGERKNILALARIEIQNKIGPVQSISAVYESKSWGFNGFDFLNQVILCKTAKTPQHCLETTQMIEKHLGRQKKSQDGQYENRLIDIDILFYNSEVYQSADLTIPHIKIAERKFTLLPLAELMPNFNHPVYKKSIQELLHICEDQSEVKKLNE